MKEDWVDLNYVISWGDKESPELVHLRTIGEQLLVLIENESHSRLKFSYQIKRFSDFDDQYSIVLFPVDSFGKKIKINPIKFSEEKNALITINNFIRQTLGLKKIDSNNLKNYEFHLNWLDERTKKPLIVKQLNYLWISYPVKESLDYSSTNSNLVEQAFEQSIEAQLAIIIRDRVKLLDGNIGLIDKIRNPKIKTNLSKQEFEYHLAWLNQVNEILKNKYDIEVKDIVEAKSKS
ncbi:MAG: hypothetical protein Q7S21_00340 [archaeon]|nr:hypothetical protein [archaeon]